MFSLAVIGAVVALVLFAAVFAAKQYKRCPSDSLLVVYGKVGKGKTADCVHGGGRLIIPLIQDYKYLSLAPIALDVPLSGALSKKNIRVNVPSTFTIAVSTNQTIQQNAAERLLNLSENEMIEQAKDIILGQLRLVIANMTIEEINTDRDTFLSQINSNVAEELNKIGLELINVNVKDITDESGYIEAIGKKAAAEAINRANVDVAEQEKTGQIGVATANKEQQVQVAQQLAETQIGQKEAEKTQRVRTAEYDAQAIEGENTSKGQIADYNADLKLKEAEAFQRGEVAEAQSQEEVANARKKAEVARLRMAELAKREVEKEKMEVDAEAEAEATRRKARGEADAIYAKYEAEAKGVQKVLEAKAEGYRKLIEAAGGDTMAPTLLTIEQLPTLVEAQAEMVKNIKIDKLTVWDSGKGETSNFVQSLGNFMVPFRDVAKNAGVNLPEFLGSVVDDKDLPTTPTGPLNGSGSNGVSGHTNGSGVQ